MSALWTAYQNHVNTSPINGLTWYYYPGLLPGDDGSKNIGDVWTYNGGYYIKLGSGMGTGNPLGGGETPEPATVVGLISAIFMLASRRVIKRKQL
jgi:hypothetical protein